MKKIFSLENKQLTFIVITMFLNFLGFSIIIPILPFLIKNYVSNPHDLAFYVGAIMSTFALCQFIAAPGLGTLSDKYGRRPVLLLSLLGSVVGYLIIAMGGSLWLLFLGRIIDGLTGGNISTVYSYVADITKPKDRSKYYGLLGAAGGAGFIFGPAIGGLTSQISLTFPLYLAAGVTVLNIIWGYFILSESLKPEHRTKHIIVSHLNPFSQFGHVFSIRSLRKIFLITFLFFLALSGIHSIAPVFFNRVYSWGPAEIGFILFVIGVFDIFSQGFLIRKLLPRFGNVKVAGIGLFLAMIGFFMASLTAFNGSVVIIYLAVIIYIIGDGLFSPSSSGIISTSVGPQAQGRVQGANIGLQSTTRIIGPILSSFLFRFWDGLPYFFNAVLMGIALVVLLISFKQIEHHED